MNLSQDAKLQRITKLDENEYMFEFENDNNFYIWSKNTGIDKYTPDMYITNMEPCRYHVSIVDIINAYVKQQ